MSEPLSTPVLQLPLLHSFATLLIAGGDARTFLQGQLCNDVRKLSTQRALLTAINSSQGRVQSILTLLERDEGIIALMPVSVLDRTVTRLKNFVLRSKVTFASDANRYAIAPISASQAVAIFSGSTLPITPGDCIHAGDLSLLRWWSADERYLLIAPATALSERDSLTEAEDILWRRADIAAGIPQVYPETHEYFVAQMLNLDLLNGISFDKGCYTGQEIIARTHYRGTLKRRMFRFTAACAPPPAGTRLLNGEIHAGEVVDVVTAAPGCELLAVVSIDQANASLSLDGTVNSALTKLSLPYRLPHEVPQEQRA
jgi:tRNA-modifying protein YgfZ